MEGRERARSKQVVGAEDRVGRGATEKALGRRAPGFDHEVGGDRDQLVVPVETARAETVEVAEAARRAGRRVLGAVDERDARPSALP